jgi:5'-methylthioadenosine phosphorylase
LSGRVGIIGGSGMGEALGALGKGESREVDTPFGRPSGPIELLEVAGVPVALLARHGPGHLHNPSQVPYRANIYALKSLGVTHVLASTACGSLREEIRPRELVIPDQLIDKTFRRPGTFFDEIAVHAEMASPMCPTLRSLLLEAGRSSPTRVHPRGTYVCMEGPQLSTRAESELHRQWGADLIGMTALPEAKLAREAELCYAMVSLPTDYDCWRPAPAELSGMGLIQEILGNLKQATANALDLMKKTLPMIAGGAAAGMCHCQSALELGIWSERSRIPADVRQKLHVLLGKYL